MRKYKLLAHAHKQIKVHKKRRKDPRKGSISLRLKDKVQSFFERDDNSGTTTGKKQTKTRYKIKKIDFLIVFCLELCCICSIST
jgi:hypothetical protein